MELEIAGIIANVLLAPLIGLNLVISMGKTFAKKVGGLVGKLVKEEVAVSPEQERHFKRLDRVFQFAWLLVGVIGVVFFFVQSRPADVLAVVGLLGGAAGIFVAFRSGALLTRFVAYAFHDRAMIRQTSEGVPLGGLVSKAILPGISANAIFLLVFALMFRFARIGFGNGDSWFPLGLWLAGLIFGYVYGTWRSRLDPRFLLQDDLGVVAFLGIMKADKEMQKIDASVAAYKAALREKAAASTEMAREAKEKVDKAITSLNEGVAVPSPKEAAQEVKEKAKRFPFPKKPKAR